MVKFNTSHSSIEASSHRSSTVRISAILLWVFILAYVIFFSAYTFQRHATFNSFASDLSRFDQPMWNTVHGRFLERTADDRQVPRTADHFEPVIIPIALVFYLWDDVRAILLVQAIALAMGALPVYWITREVLKPLRQTWLPLAFAVVYLMFPALQAANVADFHADPLVVAPLLFAFWYASQGRYRPMWAWALVVMLVKENMPTLTVMLGLYLVASKGPEDQETRLPKRRVPGSPLLTRLLTTRRLFGLGLVALSLVWFTIATFLIVAPAARQVYGTEGPVYLASRYGEAGEGLTGLLNQAIGLLALLGEPERLRYLAGLFASVGWLALLAPEYLLLGLPLLAANTFSNFVGQYSGEQHYSGPLAPVFVIAAIYGTRRLLNSLPTSRHALRNRQYASLILVWLLAWSMGYHYLRGWTPLARDFEWWPLTPHHRLLARFTDQIPPEAAVSTTAPLHPHLAHRQKIYLFPTIADADMVLVDVSSQTDLHPHDVRARIETLMESGEFGLVDAADGYLLLSRQQGASGAATTLPDAFFDFARVEEALPQYPVVVEFGERLRFLGYDVTYDAKWQRTSLRLYWQALAALPEDVRLWPFFFSEDGVLIEDTLQRPMVAPIWYPPSQWKPGETVVTETLPWDVGPRFNIGVALLRGDSDPAAAFADPARRAPITAAGPGTTLFHDETWAQVGAFARQGRRLVAVPGDPVLSSLDVTFAEGIHLVGSRLSVMAGESAPPAESMKSVSVVLAWLATTPVPRDYTLFVHLVTPGGTTVAQSDSQPTWVAPWSTRQWPTNQPVLDGQRISVPPDLPPGRYQVRVGLYYWETMERLPVLDQAQQPVGDYATVGEVQITR